MQPAKLISNQVSITNLFTHMTL